MNGAEALITTLADNGVTACFANPGTSEMQFVSALDREPRMRAVLCLFEGVATGAADGYARMAGTPACTLLHLGPGYGNGLANLHNARRAGTPVVNVVGDHATYHRVHDAPLTSDIAAIVAPNSRWVRSADSAETVGALAAEAVQASYGPAAGPVSLILPADSAWTEGAEKGPTLDRPAAPAVDAAHIEAMAAAVRAAAKPAVLMGNPAITERGLKAGARIRAAGVRVIVDTFVTRLPRGAGRFAPDRMLYFGEMAVKDLAGTDLLLLCGTKTPVAFFAYPDKPSVLLPEGCRAETLALPEEDAVGALEAFADALGAPEAAAAEPLAIPVAPSGDLNPYAIGDALARHMPEHAIVSDDAVTAGLPIFTQTKGARPHDWLMLTGGAIGQGLPAAIGAAVACPERKVVALSGDGAGMYTVQSLWTIAREGLDVLTIVFANHAYRILNIELARTGAGNPGPAAKSLLDLAGPRIDWVAMAGAMGVPAVRCTDAASFDAAVEKAMAQRGPAFIEAALG